LGSRAAAGRPGGPSATSPARTLQAGKIRLPGSGPAGAGQRDAEHARFAIETGVKDHFCGPKSPRRHGSNKNTNATPRRYLPRTVSMWDDTQNDLDEIAAELNGRPRQTCGFKTPSEALTEALR
jgi:IS30 family transposase